jgi:phage terminase large subunit-like protein
MGKPNSTRLIELRAKAKREGWAKWIRQGAGEEADEKAMLNGCRFDVRRVDHWANFAERFGILTEGAYLGKPFKLLPWQYEDTGRFFGWVKDSKEWGYPVRRFKFFFEEVPKKNGKTPLLSLLGNYLFFADCIDPNGQQRQIDIYTAATTRKQAERVLVHSIRQIKASDELSKVSTIRKLEGFQSVQYGNNNWYVVSSDPASADGVNGHCLADEFHRWKGFEFYNTLKWMLASQPEGVFAAITTAGEEGENVWKFTHDYCIGVNAGRITDETFCGRIYAADKDDDPHDDATWFKANPSLGESPDHPLKLSSFRQDYQAARSDPTAWPSFLRLRLGIPQSQTNTWIESACPRGLSDWDSGTIERSKTKDRIDCYEAFTDESLQEIDARTVTLALDLASVRDTCAAVVSICDQNNVVRVRPYFWLPIEEARRQQKRVNYRQWADAGFIQLTPGDVIDYRRILNDLVGICDFFRVERFYYDPLFQAEWLTAELEEAANVPRIEFGQTIVNYAPLVKEAERRIISHELLHNGNAVLTWQISNAISWENANGDKRIKKRTGSDYRKVDGVQAMIMSLRDCLSAEDGGSFYDTHDVEEF